MGGTTGWPLGDTSPRGPAAGGREALLGAFAGVPGDRRDPGDGTPGKAAEPGPKAPGAKAGVPKGPYSAAHWMLGTSGSSLHGFSTCL